MPTLREIWLCDFCALEYKNHADAEMCEALGFYPTFAVGDIVLCNANYFGWFDGDPEWIVDLHKKPYLFYYVVTHVESVPKKEITSLPHRPRYHLETLAMSEKQSSYRLGYTYDEGHYQPIAAVDPPENVIQQSKTLLGHKATWLL